ncbi:hypothetical protein ACWGQ5_49600 [Streptomyces sp. NPDC055722]
MTLGLQCGGSDAYSGLTANPTLGVAADLLVEAGGKIILGETPEIYGAHHLLRDRASNPAAAARIDELIVWWQEYAGDNGATLDSNPSQGNRVGGITTIWEKSLGAVLKSGTSPLNAVVGYGMPVTPARPRPRRGLPVGRLTPWSARPAPVPAIRTARAVPPPPRFRPS